MSRAPEPGTFISGKYRVERVLGVGGMGCVVAAQNLQLEQRVALKFLPPEALGSTESAERFERQARTAAKLKGEHAVRVLDLAQLDTGRPFMVLEYLEGHDLARELTACGSLPVEDALRFVLEVCEALAEAHAAHVVHGDLGLRRLFLAERPGERSRIKVLGFGAFDPTTAALTWPGRRAGEAERRAPEQLTSPKSVDARVDQWGLGAALYELLAGTPPFEGESAPLVLSAVLEGALRPLRELRLDVPVGLDAVIARCLRPVAAERFADVAVLAAALAPYAAHDDRASAVVAARVLGTPPPSPEGLAATGPRRTPSGRAPTLTLPRARAASEGAAKTPPPRAASRRPDPREEPTSERLLSDALNDAIRAPSDYPRGERPNSLRPEAPPESQSGFRRRHPDFTEVDVAPGVGRDPRREG